MKITSQKFWSKSPGNIIDHNTGEKVPVSPVTSFKLCSIFEWYDTLATLLKEVQDEHGELEAISLGAGSDVTIILVSLKCFRYKQDWFPDNLCIGSLEIDGNDIKLYPVEGLRTNNLYITTTDDKHVEIVMLDF